MRLRAALPLPFSVKKILIKAMLLLWTFFAKNAFANEVPEMLSAAISLPYLAVQIARR